MKSGKEIFVIVYSSFAGGLSICLLSVLQEWIFRGQFGQVRQYILPTAFGCALGFGVGLVLNLYIRKIRRLEVRLRQRVENLEGLFPICSYCKKIQVDGPTDQERWVQIELHLRKHACMEFSHGICPECEKELLRGEFSRFFSTDKKQGLTDENAQSVNSSRIYDSTYADDKSKQSRRPKLMRSVYQWFAGP